MTRACSACGQPFLECDCAAPAVAPAPAPSVPTLEVLQREVAVLRTVNEALATQARELLLAQPRPAHEQIDRWKAEARAEAVVELRQSYQEEIDRWRAEAKAAKARQQAAILERVVWRHVARRLRGAIRQTRQVLNSKADLSPAHTVRGKLVDQCNEALKAYRDTRRRLGSFDDHRPNPDCDCGWCGALYDDLPTTRPGDT